MEKIIVFLVAGTAVIGLYLVYVSLIKKKNKVKEAAAGVDVQLKKRYDLIPNILQMAAKFMEHEKDLMVEIVRLRSQAMEESLKTSPEQTIELEKMLKKKMNEFWLSVENYPDLKSSRTMLQAMQTYNEVEEHIAAARRFYNSSINDLKNAVEIFPGNVIARLVGVKADMPYFEAETGAKDKIDVKDFFK